MWVVAAALAWEWQGEGDAGKPDIIGPFITQEAATAFLRARFPTFADQQQPGTSPDEEYAHYTAPLLAPDGVQQVSFDDVLGPRQ